MGLAGFANLTNLIYAFEHMPPPTPTGEELLEPYLDTFVDDKFIDGSNGEYASVGSAFIGLGTCASAEYIEIPTGKSLYIDAREAPGDPLPFPMSAFYDSSKNFISGFTLALGQSETITVPTGAVYFRTTALRSYIEPTQKLKIYAV